MSQVRMECASAGLRRCWRNWTDVVERFALGHAGRRGFDPGKYEKLYRDLRAACREQAGNDADRGYYESLEVFVRPWLSLNALEQADRAILNSVMTRCREVDRRLNGRDWSHSIRLWKKQLFLVLLVAGVVAGLAFTGIWRLFREGLQVVGTLATRTFSDLTLIQGIALGGVAAVVVGVLLVARTART